jgi:8-oxo-dGTP diphosphatase
MPAADQGVFKDRYTLIPRVLIFLTRGEDILLLKGAPDKRIWPNQYNGIGGHVERGEGVLAAARRELLEETGLQAERLWLCAAITIDTGEDTGIGMYVFRGEATGEPKQTEEGLAEWVPIAEIGSLPLVEDLPALIPKALALKRGDAPLSLHYRYEGDKLEIEADK